MARPTIINDALIARFCHVLSASSSIETAIKMAGIGRTSYYRWARNVNAGRGTAPQRDFFRIIDRVEGEIKMEVERKLATYFDKHWRALKWWLERKYPEEYGYRRPPPLPNPDERAKRPASSVAFGPPAQRATTVRSNQKLLRLESTTALPEATSIVAARVPPLVADRALRARSL
jgi:hypothetical protein